MIPPLRTLLIPVAVGLLIISFGMKAKARDVDGRYADSPLGPWFKSLKSKGGAWCCDGADGTALSDVDWDTKDGHYRVRLEGEWVVVPDDAVIDEPNRAGKTMVWPYHGALGVTIRCFLPGIMI